MTARIRDLAVPLLHDFPLFLPKLSSIKLNNLLIIKNVHLILVLNYFPQFALPMLGKFLDILGNADLRQELHRFGWELVCLAQVLIDN